MGAVGNLHCFLLLRFSVTQLFGVLIMAMLLFSVSECDSTIQLEGTVGGSVTFNCKEHRPTWMLYLQKDGEFVNGFYSSREITKPKWENTRVCCNDTAVHMYNLNVSHKGLYTCFFMLTQDSIVTKKMFNLSLTARYSKPTVTHNCNGNIHSCHVNCSSHGGYPEDEIMLYVTKSGSNRRSQMLTGVSNSGGQNPETLLYDYSISAPFNCSDGEFKLSCSVAGSTSDSFPICATDNPSNLATILIAIVVLAAVVIGVIIIIYLKRKKKPPAVAADSERPKSIEHGETLPLNHISSAPCV